MKSSRTVFVVEDEVLGSARGQDLVRRSVKFSANQLGYRNP